MQSRGDLWSVSAANEPTPRAARKHLTKTDDASFLSKLGEEYNCRS
jgi:hypothetical protein